MVTVTSDSAINATRGRTAPARMIERDVLAVLGGRRNNEAESAYIRFHARRFASLINLISSRAGERLEHGAMRILDVAPHFLTTLIRQTFGEQIVLNTLGLLKQAIVPAGVADRHFEFDLNDSQERQNWIDPEPHDVVILGEILEHLYTAPDLVLSFIRTFLDRDGILIIQTPNAASLRKRLKLLFGANPYEMLQHDRQGHFREYTGRELVRLCESVGLRCETLSYGDYWPERGALRLLEKIVPSFRRGLTLVARNAE